MSVTVRVVDRVTRVAPFGVRFWDEATNAPVPPGLQVILHPNTQPWRRVSARPNRSGVYVLHEGPGLAEAVRGRGDEQYWQDISSNPGRRKSYRCEVVDPQSRFHRVSFDVQLPFKGLFTPDCMQTSPPGINNVPLFSTPTREVPNAMAVIRAQLVNAATGEPAAWAFMTAEYQSVVRGRGVADDQGRIAILLPFPEPERRPLSSPPSPLPLAENSGVLMQWSVRLRVFHAPQLASSPIPNYCDVLTQPEADLLDVQSPPQPIENAAIALGRETVLASQGQSYLWVAPA